MTGPPCGELSRYLDEVRTQRKAVEAEAKKAAVDAFIETCMAMPGEMPTAREVLASIAVPWRAKECQWHNCEFCGCKWYSRSGLLCVRCHPDDEDERTDAAHVG